MDARAPHERRAHAARARRPLTLRARVCIDEGLTLTLENTSDTHVTATLTLIAQAEESSRCEVFLEAP
jgi:hypothetical protein